MLGKTTGEKTAWELVKELPEERRPELVVINPGFIVGPNLNSRRFASGDFIKMFMMGELKGLGKIQVPFVDVRDVAQAHLNAVLKEDARNKRFILVSKCLWYSEVANILNDEYGKYYPSIPTTVYPCGVHRLASLFSSESARAVASWEIQQTFDTSST